MPILINYILTVVKTLETNNVVVNVINWIGLFDVKIVLADMGGTGNQS